jgi:hypothetical protein
MPVLCLQINIVNQLLLFIANVYFVLLCCLSLFQCLLIFSSNLFVCHKFSRLFLVQIDMLAIIYIYRITGNFCSFGLKRRHLMFADFFLLRIEKSHHRKKFVCITGSDVMINNWCTSQWSLEVKTYSILWKVFKGYSFWIRIWLTSNLS